MGKPSKPSSKTVAKKKVTRTKALPSKPPRIPVAVARKPSLTNDKSEEDSRPPPLGWEGCFTAVAGPAGSWNCAKCTTRNNDDDDKCAACESKRQDPAAPSSNGLGSGVPEERSEERLCATMAAATVADASSHIGPAGFVFGGETTTATATTASSPAAVTGAVGVQTTTTAGDSNSPPLIIDWTFPFIVGEQLHTDAMKNLHNGPFDFDHLSAEVARIKKENPGCDAYLFGGSPFSFDFGEKHGPAIRGVTSVPSICVILVKSGHHPPELIAVRDYQKGGERVAPFQHLRLKWQPVDGWDGVFALRCMMRSCAMANKAEEAKYVYEYASLYTMTPSKEWNLNRHGKLDVKHVIFAYESADLDDSPVWEEFDREYHRLNTFIPDFLKRNELGTEHYDLVQEAIRAAFDSARKQKEEKIKLFDGYDPKVLNDMKVIKIYPQNDFITCELKLPMVNEYYGSADSVV